MIAPIEGFNPSPEVGFQINPAPEELDDFNHLAIVWTTDGMLYVFGIDGDVELFEIALSDQLELEVHRVKYVPTSYFMDLKELP